MGVELNSSVRMKSIDPILGVALTIISLLNNSSKELP